MILLKQINQIKGIASGQANNVQIGFRKSARVRVREKVEIVFLFINECVECGGQCECAAYVLCPPSLSVIHSILLSIVIIYLILNGPQNFIRHSGVHRFQSQKSIELDEK